VGINQKLKPKKKGIALKIDDNLKTMNWLKKFNSNLIDDKLDYKYNEYESSGFDPINIRYQDSIKDTKKEITTKDFMKKHSFKDLNYDILKVIFNFLGLTFLPSTLMPAEFQIQQIKRRILKNERLDSISPSFLILQSKFQSRLQS
jgi:hypothetical protein